METDKELQGLYERWERLEEEIIDDEAVIAATLQAFKLLEMIFDRGCKDGKGVASQLREHLRSLYGDERLLERYLRLDEGIEKGKIIGMVHAGGNNNKIIIYKSSILFRFLEQTTSGRDIDQLKKIYERWDKYCNTENIGESEIVKEHPKAAIGAIKIFLDLLERNIAYLKDNQKKILGDLSYEFSLVNIILHEMVHHCWEILHHKCGFIHKNFSSGINEAWAHVINVLGNLYQNNIILDEDNLNREIEKLEKMIRLKATSLSYSALDYEDSYGKKRDYPFSIYDIMKPCMRLFGAMVLTDVLLKEQQKNVDSIIKKAIVSTNIAEIYNQALWYLNRIEEKRLRKIVYKRLIRPVSNDNERVTITIVQKSRLVIDYFPNYEINEIKEKLDYVLSLIAQLSIFGRENEATRLTEELTRKIEDYFSKLKEKSRSVEEMHRDIIDNVASVIEDEEKSAKIIERLLE